MANFKREEASKGNVYSKDNSNMNGKENMLTELQLTLSDMQQKCDASVTSDKNMSNSVLLISGCDKSSNNSNCYRRKKLKKVGGPSTHKLVLESKEQKKSHPMQDLYDAVTDVVDEPRTHQAEVSRFSKVLKKHSLLSKLVYVFSILVLMLVSHSTLSQRWLLPWLVTAATPLLYLLRLIQYTQMKYQYFMLDFCYFSNLFWYCYLWICPGRADIFAIAFSQANGPLIWALFIFQNSMVFHSLDKVTSMYIHTMPSLLSFIIRWYPEEVSFNWHEAFPKENMGWSFQYLSVMPFVFGLVHTIFYSILVVGILRPSEEYTTLYSYCIAREDNWIFKLANIFGPRWRFTVFYFFWNLFNAILQTLSMVWYNNYIAHCIFMMVFITISFYNGATYYIDVFQYKKNKGESQDTSSGRSIDAALVENNERKEGHM